MGVILFSLLSGKLPFADENKMKLFMKIITCDYETPTHLSHSASNLVKSILKANPKERATMNMIMIDSWVMDGYETSPSSHLPLRPLLRLPLEERILNIMKNFGVDDAQNDILMNRKCLLQNCLCF
jgi:serine/threonine protein kinase